MYSGIPTTLWTFFTTHYSSFPALTPTRERALLTTTAQLRYPPALTLFNGRRRPTSLQIMATRSSRRINDDNNNIITNKLQQATLSSYQSHHQLHHHLLTTHTLLFHHIIIITYIIATICYSQCPSFSHFPSLRSLLSPLSLSLLRLREILSLSSTNLQIYILRRTLFLPFPTHRHNTGQNCHVIPQVAHPRQSGDHAKDPDTRSRHPEK